MKSVFWRYWSASTTSRIGDAVTTVALPILAITALDASSLGVGILTAAGLLAWTLIGLPAGVLVRRHPLRGLQVSLDLARAVVVATIPVAYFLGVLTLTHLVVASFLVGLASVLFDVSNSTFLADIVDREELVRRNSMTSASTSATQLAGPSIGGVLVQCIGAAASLIIDVLTYLVSASLLRSLPQRPAEVSRSEPVRMRESIRDGMTYIVGNPVMLVCVVVATIANLTLGAVTTLVPILLVRDLGTPPALVGVLIASEGVGALAATAVVNRLSGRWGSGRLTLAAAGVFATGLPLVALSAPGPGLILFAVGNAVVGAGVVTLSILFRSHRQSAAPRELLSRVMATTRFISWSASPIGAVVAGALALSSVRGVLWGAVVLAISPIVILFASPVRRIRDLEDTVVGSPS